MNRQTVMFGLIALLAPLSAVLADKEEKVHDGIIVSVTADTLAMTDADGKNEHAHKVDAAVAVTIDGKPAKVPDLAKGDKVKVAVGQDGKVVRVTATRAEKK